MTEVEDTAKHENTLAVEFRHRHFEECARLHPEEVAVIADACVLTYGEVNALADRVAVQLRKLGVGPGVVAAMYLERSPELVITILSLLKCGGACLHLDPAWSGEQTFRLLALGEPRVLLTSRRLDARLPNGVERVVYVEDFIHGEASDGTQPPLVVEYTTEMPERIFFTSGTTGAPKATVWAYRRQRRPDRSHTGEFLFAKGDRVLVNGTVSLSPIILQTLIPLLAGATIVILPPGLENDAEQIIEHVVRHQVTVLAMVPTQLRLLLETGRLSECTHLYTVATFGEVMPPAVEESFWSHSAADLIMIYGASEATSAARRFSRTGQLPVGNNLGKPMPGRTIHICDENGHELPVGDVGEIYIGGPGIALGYFKDEVLTRERFVPDPFSGIGGARLFKTGDRGRWLSDGTIEFVGRIDDLVKTRGHRVELSVVESVLNRLPGVSQSAVAAWDDGRGNSMLAAYVVPTPPADRETLRAWRERLRKELPLQAVPQALILMDQLPVTASGKVNRKALSRPTMRSAWLEKAWEVPQSPVEVELAAIWCEVLELDQVGSHDRFFDLGGTSLKAMLLLEKLQSRCQVQLQPRLILLNPSLAELAASMGQATKPGDENATIDRGLIVQLRKGPAPQALFVFPGGWGGENEMLVFAAMLRHLKPGIPVYAVNSGVADASWEFPEALSEQAAAVLDSIERLQPEGPYLFLGECAAGPMAAEVAVQAEGRGHPPGVLIVMDSNLRIDEDVLFSVKRREEPANWRNQPLRLRRYYEMLWTWEPAPLRSAIHLVLSEGIPAPEEVLAYWRILARGELKLHQARGNHESYIREYAADTAVLLDSLLPTSA